MRSFIVVHNGGHSPWRDDTAYPVDTPEELRVAQRALREIGQERATVYFGDPECPDSYPSGLMVYAEES